MPAAESGFSYGKCEKFLLMLDVVMKTMYNDNIDFES